MLASRSLGWNRRQESPGLEKKVPAFAVVWARYNELELNWEGMKWLFCSG